MVKEKIDIVYLWVDGSDPIWRAKRNNAYENLKNTDTLEEFANVEWRFRNNNELLYSLRSLEKYFPEHGKIFIITDHQIPDFIKKNDDRIKIIYHNDFIDSDILPTFSSKKIEAFISRIPEISNTFFYFNDDVFLWPQFRIDHFINDKPIYYFIPNEHTDTVLSNNSIISSESILKEKYSDYQISRTYSAHAPKIIIKESLNEMFQLFPHLFENITHEIFRSKSNPSLLADLYPRWMVHTGKGISGWEAGWYFRSLEDYHTQIIDTFPLMSFFCINDTHDNCESTNSGLLDIANTLEKLFPEKSSLEKK